MNPGDYAYVPNVHKPNTWKLQINDAVHVGGAIAALTTGFRGQKVDIPDADLPGVKARVIAAWKKFHPDKNPADCPLKTSVVMQHSELKHWGVLGMHWGIRKDRETISQRVKNIQLSKLATRKAKSDNVMAQPGKKTLSQQITAKNINQKMTRKKSRFGKTPEQQIQGSSHQAYLQREEARRQRFADAAKRVGKTPYRDVNKHKYQFSYKQALATLAVGAAGVAIASLIRAFADPASKQLAKKVLNPNDIFKVAAKSAGVFKEGMSGIGVGVIDAAIRSGA